MVSGILHVLKIGCRWQDCPSEYGPSTTVYTSFRGKREAKAQAIGPSRGGQTTKVHALTDVVGRPSS